MPLLAGFAAVLFSMTLGVALGLISGYAGGRIDSVIMRIADVQLSFPAILAVPPIAVRFFMIALARPSAVMRHA